MADLTTLQAVKSWMGLSDPVMDGVITGLITRVSAQVETYISRSLLTSARVELRDGGGGSVMLLRDQPVQSITSLTINDVAVPASTGPGVGGYWLGSDGSLYLRGFKFTIGRGNVSVEYVAGYDTIPPDVEQCVIESVALAIKRADHVDVSSKSLAGETISYIHTSLTPAAKQVLDQWRRVVPL